MAIRLDEERLRLLKMYGELSPSTNNTYNVGTSSLKFANMYATTFHGALDGNANTATALTSSAGSTTQPIYFSNGKPVAITGNIANGTTGNAATATKATQDADGNTISSTYLKCSGGTMTGSIYYGNSGLYYTNATYGYQQIKALYLTIDKNNLSSSSIYSYVPTQITTDFGSNNYIDIIPTGFHTSLYLGKTFTRQTYETAGDTSSNYTSQTYVTNTCIALRGMNSTTKELSPYYNIYSFPPNFGDDTSTKQYYILTSRNIKISSTNKLLYTSGTSYGGSLSTSNHYASSTKIAINSTSSPSYNLYVNGSTGHNGSITVTSNHITVDNGDIYINKNYYPAIYLTATTKNSASTYSRAFFQGDYSDNVSMGINSDSTTTTKSRRGLVVYGYAQKANASQAVALRQCDTSGTWQNDLYLLHSGNYNSYALPLSGGTISGKIVWSGASAVVSSLTSSNSTQGLILDVGMSGSGIYKGNGDNITTGTNGQANIIIKSWYGVGFATSCYNVTNPGISLNIDTRTGDLNTIGKVYGAVWNDYAEYRSTEIIEPGRVVREDKDSIMKLTTERLMPACEIISDTFGFAIGETDECKTPIAATGRVLAYPYEDRYSFELGDAVCSGPNGTVSKMTREELMIYPERMIGTVSEIPEYKTWGSGNVEVDGRIWIRVR